MKWRNARLLLAGGVVVFLSSTGSATAMMPSPVATAEESHPVTLTAPPELSLRLRQRAMRVPARPPSSTVRKVETVLVDETFEASWPTLPWRVEHPADAADVDWARSSYRASDGSFSIWCAGAGSDAPGAGEVVPVNAESWAVAGPFDLSEAAEGSLSFDLWLASEPFHDNFMWLASTDGESFSGRARSTDTNGWKAIAADLTAWGGSVDLTGEPLVWIAFVYTTDHDGQLEGAYVDRVRLVADSGEQVVTGRTYTTDDDFAEGELVGVKAASGALLMSGEWSALPYLWVAATGAGTVSKVDTGTGDELGRYRTGPDDVVREPSPTVVDLDGSCWAGNRAAGSVVKIGLEERGECVDRDGDGAIATSRDVDGDGDISGAELLAWGEDECVLHEVLLVEDSEAVYTPGDDVDGYADVDLQALAVDRDNNLWVGVAGSQSFYLLDGTSAEILSTVDLESADTTPFRAVVDSGGDLWCSSWPDAWVLRVDAETQELEEIALEHGSLGLALDGAERLFVSGYEASALSRVDLATAEVDLRFNVDFQSSGMAVTENGELWVAAPASQLVRRYSADGNVLASIGFTNFPSAVAVDGAGRVWVSGLGSGVLVRIDPATNLVNLQKQLVNVGGHDAAGDMTGLVARTITAPYGSWNVVYDSEQANTAWGTLSWTATVSEGSSLEVRVRSSHDEELWSGWESAVDGEALASTPAGRFLEIEVAMRNLSAESSPRLDELTVMPAIVTVAPEADFSWSPAAPVVGESVSFTDASANDPSAWTWDFGDGGSSSDQNPSHVFTTAGSFDVSLTASNTAGEDVASKQLTVQAAADCEISCSALVAGSAKPGVATSFTAVVEAEGCGTEPLSSWDFGDGGGGEGYTVTHAYAEEGEYRWELTVTGGAASCSTEGTLTVAAAPEECSNEYWVPVVSHADGAEGSVWRSDLALLNPGGDQAAVELRLHAASGVILGTASLASGSSIDLADVVAWLNPGATTSAALQVCSDAPLRVSARTYNQLAEGDPCGSGGTFGQGFAGMSPEGGLQHGETGYLVQLRENDAFRSNLGFANAGDEAALVQYTLHSAAGEKGTSFIIQPGTWVQHNRPYNDAGFSDVSAGWTEVKLIQGDGVFVYASVIDNLTNDATTVMLQR